MKAVPNNAAYELQQRRIALTVQLLLNDVTAVLHDAILQSTHATLPIEEEAIVRYTIKLYERSFPPTLRSVEDMANQLLRARDALTVSKLWWRNDTGNFAWQGGLRPSVNRLAKSKGCPI